MVRIFVLLCALLLAGCGFQPLYATDGAGSPGLRGVALATLNAPDEVDPVIRRAFARRGAAADASAQFDLALKASEQAERLAVQIDASVTRYNYRLVGDYTLIERGSGRRIDGNVVSIASFNVVDSQYSTLFAEDTAREKAAKQLIEDIERDILLKMSEAKAGK